jgi:hypothetical protein
MATDPRRMSMILTWSHPENFPGIYETEYRGARLRIQPAGGFEWDGLINDAVCYGTDDLEIIEAELIRIVNGDPEPDHRIIVTQILR